MHLRSISLRDFRNYAELELLPSDGINLLVGENAQGKSNLLEAVYLLATTRSIRASRESEMVRRGAEFGIVTAEVCRETNADAGLEVTIFESDKKVVKTNGLKRGRVIELLGHLNAVHFSSNDLSLVSGEPSLRRRFLNVEISQISPKYCHDLANYKKALEQRNRLLRDLRERPYAESGLEAWNEQIVTHGTPIYEKRRFFVDRLAPLANDIHQELTENREQLVIQYLPSIPLPSEGSGDIGEAFRENLARLGSEEIRRGVTLCGPQRDDLHFLINGADARLYGSQGQQRTVVLSLKLAQFRLMSDFVGEPPVMLLDDVMSDLDDRRRGQLFSTVHDKCQTFVTCTSLRDFPASIIAEATVYRVDNGSLFEDDSANNTIGTHNESAT